MSARAAWLVLAAGCNAPRTAGDPDLGPIEATLTDEQRAAWPGADSPDGRVVAALGGFFDGAPAAFWDFGEGTRDTSDSFWFCRDGDAGCPLDEWHRLAWDRAVGLPLVVRAPGQVGYSPVGQVWVVRVAADFPASSVKTAESLHALASAGEVTVEPLVIYFDPPVGPRDVLVHLPLVLEGTRLERNGEAMRDDTTRLAAPMETRQAWHEGHRVNLVDFTRTEGTLPAADDSLGHPLSPVSDLYLPARACEAEPRPEICDADAGTRSVSEPAVGRDVTGDGDLRDSNAVAASAPCAGADADRVYSPLRRVLVASVDPSRDADVALIDRSRDDAASDVASVADLWALVGAGAIAAPRPAGDGDGVAPLLLAPTQVADGAVPYPCPDRR